MGKHLDPFLIKRQPSRIASRLGELCGVTQGTIPTWSQPSKVWPAQGPLQSAFEPLSESGRVAPACPLASLTPSAVQTDLAELGWPDSRLGSQPLPPCGASPPSRSQARGESLESTQYDQWQPQRGQPCRARRVARAPQGHPKDSRVQLSNRLATLTDCTLRAEHVSHSTSTGLWGGGALQPQTINSESQAGGEVLIQRGGGGVAKRALTKEPHMMSVRSLHYWRRVYILRCIHSTTWGATRSSAAAFPRAARGKSKSCPWCVSQDLASPVRGGCKDPFGSPSHTILPGLAGCSSLADTRRD